MTLRSGKELPEPTLKKNSISKSPIEEEKVEEILEEDKEQEKETSPLPSSPKATQSRDKGKEKLKNDALLRVLDSNDDLESFTFDDNALINENDDALHKIVCGDDDIHVDDSVCDMNDVEIMPPKSRHKECAKKRKHDVGTSSGAVQGESDLLIAGGRSLRHLTAKQYERVEELVAKGVSGGFYFDYTMLDAYGCRAEVEWMMSRRYWEHLFSWRDDTYEPVVHEFIATYARMPSNHMWTPCMKFTLFGREHEVSLIQLGEYLGFYTAEDVHTEEWCNLPTDFDSDAAAEAYWDRITNGQGGRFTGTKPNTSKIVSLALKIMKLLLNLTFGAVHLADTPEVPYVRIGPMVTRLCHGLGLQRELTREKSIASMRPFSDAHLNRSYAPKIGAAPKPPQGEPQQEQEQVIQGCPDVPPEYAEYPPVYDWASMRAFQLQLHTQSMNAFNQRMDLHHGELMRQNEAIIRQEERQEQQFQAIEQLRLWIEHRFPPPSQGGDAPY
nr:hypothetical protein Iba_chr12cCG13650 [Ipomoea batatas]